jgi:4-hydroxybenzoate polyprenyltransferase
MSRPRAQGKLVRIVSRIRVRDAIIFQAPTIIAMALRVPDLGPNHLVPAMILTLGSFLIMAHVFAFNDWADMALDYRHLDKRSSSLVELGIASREMFYLAMALAIGGLVAVAFVSTDLIPIAGKIMLLGIAYSFPTKGLKAKGMPVVSSLLHFAGTVLTYLLGAAAFARIDSGAILLGCYFGLLITAGHLVQEVQDYGDDKQAGVRTNAVQFGPSAAFLLSFGLFGTSFLFLVWLARVGLVPAIAGYSVILFPIYAYWVIRVYRSGMPRSAVSRLRNQYRLLFAVVALVMLTGAAVEKVL